MGESFELSSNVVDLDFRREPSVGCVAPTGAAVTLQVEGPLSTWQCGARIGGRLGCLVDCGDLG